MNLTDRQREIIRVTFNYCLANYEDLNDCLYSEEEVSWFGIEYSEIVEILKLIEHKEIA